MSDYITSLKAILYERAVSPLFGTFALSAALWNYRFFLLIFSDLPVDGKLIYIDYILYRNSLEYKLLNVIAMPLLLTGLAIFLYPVISKPVYKFVVKKKNELTKIKEDSDSKFLDNKIRRLQNIIVDQRVELLHMVNSKDDEIANLKERLEALSKAAAEINKGMETSVVSDMHVHVEDDELAESQLEMMLEVARNEPYFVENFDSKFSSLRNKYDRDILQSKNMIRTEGRRRPAGGIRQAFEVTAKGRAYLVSKGHES